MERMDPLMMRPFSNKRRGLITVPTLLLQIIVLITVNNIQCRIVFRINKTENISNFSCSLSFSFQKSKRSLILICMNMCRKVSVHVLYACISPKAPGIL